MVRYKINIPNPEFLVEKNSIHNRSKHQKIPKRNPDVDNSSLGDPYISCCSSSWVVWAVLLLGRDLPPILCPHLCAWGATCLSLLPPGAAATTGRNALCPYRSHSLMPSALSPWRWALLLKSDEHFISSTWSLHFFPTIYCLLMYDSLPLTAVAHKPGCSSVSCGSFKWTCWYLWPTPKDSWLVGACAAQQTVFLQSSLVILTPSQVLVLTVYMTLIDTHQTACLDSKLYWINKFIWHCII